MLTQEQLVIRAKGIGGSEIAAVAGLSPWMKPIDVYLTKLGLAEPFEETFHTERGTFIEPGLIAWYQHRYGRESVTFPGTIVHAKHPLVIATPDAVADDECVVEIKSPHWRTAADWGEEGTDLVPEYYLPQVTWEMAVTGLKRADVVALLDGNIRRLSVDFDQDLFEALLEEASRFWSDHVIAREPPPADGSVSYSNYILQRFHPQDDIEICDADDRQTMSLIETYREAATAFEEAETAKRLARQQLELRIGDKKGLKGPWGSISYKKNKDSEVLNYAALVEALNPPPELMKAHRVTRKGPRVFRPYFKKETA